MKVRTRALAVLLAGCSLFFLLPMSGSSAQAPRDIVLTLDTNGNPRVITSHRGISIRSAGTAWYRHKDEIITHSVSKSQGYSCSPGLLATCKANRVEGDFYVRLKGAKGWKHLEIIVSGKDYRVLCGPFMECALERPDQGKWHLGRP